MNFFVCFCLLLVQTNAFRVPLPYGTGIPAKGQGFGDQGIFDGILFWLPDPDDDIQGNLKFTLFEIFIFCPKIQL